MKPKFQVMPDLTPDEYEALTEDIKINGVIYPIIIDQDGNVIDGHNRREIADKLGIQYPTEVREYVSDDERRDAALALNVKRRHLNQAQIRQLIKSELDRTPEASNREIGRRLAVDHHTVGAVRRVREVGNLPTAEVSSHAAKPEAGVGNLATGPVAIKPARLRRSLEQASADVRQALQAVDLDSEQSADLETLRRQLQKDLQDLGRKLRDGQS